MTQIVFPRDLAGELRSRISSGTWAKILEQEQDPSTAAMAADNRARAERVRPIPSEAHLARMLDTAYVASLLEEEGRPVLCSLAYLSAEGARARRFETIPFASPSPFNASTLAKLSPVAESGRTEIGVWPEGEDLIAWGLIHHGDQTFAIDLEHKPTHLSLRLIRPGTLTVHFDERLQFLFARDHGQFFERNFDLLGTIRDGAMIQPNVAAALCRVARRMLALGHGGTILVVDRGSNTNHGLVFNPAFTPSTSPHSVLAEAMRRHEQPGPDEVQQMGESISEFLRRRGAIEKAHDEALDLVAQLSAVDGAVVLDHGLGLLGFGATIQTPDSAMPPEVVLQDPREAGAEYRAPLTSLGGNRHRSAVCFCAQQSGLALALVASQDGDLSFFARRPDGLVHAIRPFELGVGL